MLDGRTLITAAIIIYVCALLWGREEQYKLWTALFVLFIAFIAFHAESIYDLNNYYAGQGNRASLSLFEYYDVIRDGNDIGAYLWMWVWSKFRYLGFLPAMTVVAFYSSMLAVLFAVWSKMQARRKYLVLAIFFLLCTTKYYSVLAGIRNHMGFFIFALAFICEFLLEKDWRLCWMGYLLALTFHTSIFVLFMLRLFLALYRRWPNQLLMIGLLVATAFGYPIIQLAADATGSEFLKDVANKTEAYYGGEGETDNLSLGNLSTAWVKLICISLLLLYAYAMYRKGMMPAKYRSYLDYVFACTVFSIGGGLGSQHTLVRFPEFLGLLVAPLLIVVLLYGEKIWDNRTSKWIRSRYPRYPMAFFWLFILDSGMFAAFQFLGTWTLIGWQTPALIVGSIR